MPGMRRLQRVRRCREARPLEAAREPGKPEEVEKKPIQDPRSRQGQ